MPWVFRSDALLLTYSADAAAAIFAKANGEIEPQADSSETQNAQDWKREIKKNGRSKKPKRVEATPTMGNRRPDFSVADSLENWSKIDGEI